MIIEFFFNFVLSRFMYNIFKKFISITLNIESDYEKAFDTKVRNENEINFRKNFFNVN